MYVLLDYFIILLLCYFASNTEAISNDNLLDNTVCLFSESKFHGNQFAEACIQ